MHLFRSFLFAFAVILFTPYLASANWPVAKYTNGTVGLKNDGGVVQIQSTDLMVDGNVNVSGKFFVQDRDFAEYEDRVSSLETSKTPAPPVCQPPGGDKVQFDGEKWTCVCVSEWWSGDSCETPPVPSYALRAKIGGIEQPSTDRYGYVDFPYIAVQGDKLYVYKKNISELNLDSMDETDLININTNGTVIYDSTDNGDNYGVYETSAKRTNNWIPNFVTEDYILAFVQKGTYNDNSGFAKYIVKPISGTSWTTLTTGVRYGWQNTEIVESCISSMSSLKSESESLHIIALQKKAPYSTTRPSWIELYINSGTSNTWSLKQEIAAESSIASIVLSNFTDAYLNDDKYYLALSVQDDLTDKVKIYINENVLDVDSNSWILTQTIKYEKHSRASIQFCGFGCEPAWQTMFVRGPLLLIGVQSAKTSYGTKNCSFIEIFGTNSSSKFEQRQVISPFPCMGRFRYHTNGNILAAVDIDRNLVHIYSKYASSGQFVRVDLWEYKYDTFFNVNLEFASNVYVSESDDVFVQALKDTFFGDGTGSLLWYKRKPPPPASPSPPPSSPPTGDCVSGYFESFASDGDTALCMYAYGSSSLCATNGAGENDEVCANTYTSGDFQYSHSCRVNGAWDEVCIANLCLSSELCTGYQKSVTGTTYWLQGGSGSQASYSNSNYKCCRENLPL